MSWRYRDRETKQLVSSANYHRSRTQGGTRFERVSDAKWSARGSAKTLPKRASVDRSGLEPAPSRTPLPKPTFREQPKTAKDYATYYDQYELVDFDVEYETGVDY